MAGTLAGRVALVTGASSGIGETIAIDLAAAGARVAVSARRGDLLDALVARIAAAGGKALAVPGDVSEEAAATAAVEKTIAHFGKIDILVNAAGIIDGGGIEGTTTEQYLRVVNVNLMAAVYTCKTAVPAMRAQGSGDIINISSLAGKKPAKLFSAYTASKHALNAMTDAMRQEIAGYGIRVCIINPGATATNAFTHLSDPGAREKIRAHVSKEGSMQAQDVADAAMLVLTLPPRANISELSIRPTSDASA